MIREKQQFSMQCNPVSMERVKKSSVLTNINVLIHRAKNTKLYHVNHMQTKPQAQYFKIHCSCLRIFAYTHDKRVVSELCERVATVLCACVHLYDCFPVEGHIFFESIHHEIYLFANRGG